MARRPRLRRPTGSAAGPRPASGRFFAGWRGLGRFWLLILLLGGAGAGWLAWRGPPPPPAEASHAPASHPVAEAPTHPPAASETPQRTASRPPDPPARDPAGPAAAPDAALQEPGPDGAPAPLPRIAADGRQPMQVYAASFDRSTKLPRVAVLVAGMALSEADSLAAARALPPAVSFAISPYGGAIPQVVAALRATRHEFLLSIPMEPQGFPLSDPGDRALMSNLSRADNRARLLWALSRTTGYVGATAALGELRGQRFLGLPDQMEPVLADLAGRGLLFVDSRAGEPPLPAVWSRGIDLVLDEPPRSDAIDARLAELEALARSKGAALGLVDVPRPMTVQRLAAWSAGLRERGFVLAPVSAIVQPPPKDVPQ